MEIGSPFQMFSRLTLKHFLHLKSDGIAHKTTHDSFRLFTVFDDGFTLMKLTVFRGKSILPSESRVKIIIGNKVTKILRNYDADTVEWVGFPPSDAKLIEILLRLDLL